MDVIFDYEMKSTCPGAVVVLSSSEYFQSNPSSSLWLCNDWDEQSFDRADGPAGFIV